MCFRKNKHQINNNYILIITPVFAPSIGGIEEQVYCLSDEFRNLGYEVDILVTNTPSKPSHIVQNNGVRVYYTNGSILKRIYNIIRFSQNKHLILSRQYFQNSVILGVLKFFRLIQGTSIVCADSGGECDEIVVIKKGLKYSWLIKLYFYLIQRNDFLNCLNNDNVIHLKEILGGGSEKKITRIYNGIHAIGGLVEKPKNINTISYLGRIVKEKGILELIEAFKNITGQNLQLKIAGGGEGALMSEIKRITNSDKRISIVGPVYGQQKKDFITQTDLFVLPSYSEGFPITPLEMAIENKAMICTDVADLKNVFGDNILYVNKMDVSDLCEKMEWMIQNYNSWSYSYKKALEKTNIKTVAKNFLELTKTSPGAQ